MQESFGPFYRIEQLVLSTTGDTKSQFTLPSGQPSIVTDANIKLLFSMQAQIDALEAPVPYSNETATLEKVCYKPLGDSCATQSVLQVHRLFTMITLPGILKGSGELQNTVDAV